MVFDRRVYIEFYCKIFRMRGEDKSIFEYGCAFCRSALPACFRRFQIIQSCFGRHCFQETASGSNFNGTDHGIGERIIKRPNHAQAAVHAKTDRINGILFRINEYITRPFFQSKEDQLLGVPSRECRSVRGREDYGPGARLRGRTDET